MVKRIFRMIDGNGSTVVEKEKEVCSCWADITLEQYCQFMSVLRHWKSYEDDLKDMEGQPDYEEREIQNAVFMADAVIALTGLDSMFIHQMTSSDLLNFYEDLEFASTTLPQGMLDSFFFQSATDEQINKSKKALKLIPFTKQFKRAALTAEIKLMERSHFTIKKNYGEMSLKQHIGATRVIQEIKRIESEMKTMNFDRLPELIAYCVEINGQVFDIKKAKELAPVFKKLPFETAVQVSNFFLGSTIVSSNNLETFLKIHKYLRMINPKHRKSEG